MQKTVAILVDNTLDSDVRVLKEINMLTDLGYRVKVLCFAFGSDKTYSTFDVIRLPLSQKIKNLLYFFNLWFPFYEWYWKKQVKTFLKKNSIDLVHAHDLYMARIARYAGKLADCPVVLDLHENYPVAYATYSWTNRGFRKLFTRPKAWAGRERRYLNYADAFVFLSTNFHLVLYKRYPELESRPYLVLPNFPDVSVFANPQDKEPRADHLRLLYFGGIAERRGMFEVMETFNSMLSQYPKMHLEIIGPADKRDKAKFERLLSAIPGENVNYIPWVELKNLPKYMNRAHVGLAPFEKNDQHESGIANKIFQYMYGGLALLVSDCKPQEDLVLEENIGRSFSSEKKLMDAIKFFNENLDETIEMGERGKAVLNEKYSKETFLPRLDSFYKKVLQL